MNTPSIFDRTLLMQRRARVRNFAAHDVIHREAAERLVDRLFDIDRVFQRALVLESQGDILRCALEESGRAEQVSAGLIPEDEVLPYSAESFDLIVILFELHAVNDVPGVLVQLRQALMPDGLLVAVVPGARSLEELRSAFAKGEMAVTGGVSPRVHPFIDVRDGGGLLQRAGFALPVADVDLITVRYSTLGALFADLRGAAESNILQARRRVPMTKALLGAVAAHYPAGEDGRLPATLELVTLTGWKPHASQQQPAKRGSGNIRLIDILK